MVIVIRVHLVKLHNNYASTLKEFQKCLLIMSKECFEKSSESCDIIISSMYPQIRTEKCAARTIFFSLTIVVWSPSMFLYETNVLYEGGHSIANSILTSCTHFFKRMKPAYILDIKHTVNFAWKISPIASDDWV